MFFYKFVAMKIAVYVEFELMRVLPGFVEQVGYL